MSENQGRLRLAAILAADVVGYSRLMGRDERATVAMLTECRGVFRAHIEANGGRVVDMAGDSVLAVFDNAIGAARAAVDVQAKLAARNDGVHGDRRMLFRVGVNLGDVIETADGTVYGNGVNVAARLESMANPGGINVSGSVFDSVRAKLDTPFDFLGEHEVKNVAEPVRIYRVATAGESRIKAAPKRARRRAVADAAAVGVVLATVAAWQLSGGLERSDALTATDRAVSLTEGPSVIVLPFAEIGGEETDSYFGEGLAQDITTALTGFPDLRVLDSGTATDYRGKDPDARELHRELGVDYVLKGAIQRDGPSIRINLQLLDGEAEESVWAQRFDEDLTAQSLFEIQDEVTQAVVRQVAQSDAAIQQAERRRTQRVPAPALDAYDCVLRAEHARDLLEPASHAEARDCLEKAVAAHPGYARAWSSLALIYLDEHRFGYNVRADPLGRAAEAAREAIALDPADADAHMTLGYIHYSNRDAEATRSAMDKALSLAPDVAENLAFAADMLSMMGHYGYANQLYHKAVTINPGHPEWYNWTPFRKAFAEGDWDTAIALMTKAEQGAPDFYWHPAALAASLALQGRIEEARAKLARALELKPDFADTVRDELAYFNLGPRAAVVANKAIRGLALAGLDVSDTPIFPNVVAERH